MRQPTHEPNDSTRAGQKACERVLFADKDSSTSRNRFGVEAIHTRLNAVEWFVFDADVCDKDNGNLASLIRQHPSFEKAIEGLATFTPEPDADDRRLALVAFLDDGTEVDDLSAPSWDSSGTVFEIGQREYLVLTDDEATSEAHEYIEESLWAFNASFLIGFMPDGITEAALQGIAEASCEDASPIFKALIEAGKGLVAFNAEAIAADGRGHFLSRYDGEENENDDATLFIYRTN